MTRPRHQPRSGSRRQAMPATPAFAMVAPRTPRRGRLPRTDRGSAALEAALVAPVLVAFTLLVVYLGRISQAEATIQRATSEAARAASMRQHPADAVEDARATVDSNLTEGGVPCETLTIDVDTSRFGPGGRVTVEVTCVASMADVTLLGVPGSRSFTAQEVEIVDRYRAAGADQ